MIKMQTVYGFVLCCLLASAMAQRYISDAALKIALSNDDYVRTEINCLLGRGNCDPVGNQLKKLAPMVLRSGCRQCTSNDNRQIAYGLQHIQRNYPHEWNQIVNRYSG